MFASLPTYMSQPTQSYSPFKMSHHCGYGMKAFGNNPALPLRVFRIVFRIYN